MKRKQTATAELGKTITPMLNQKPFWYRFRVRLRKDFPLYMLALPALTILIIFKYIPMYGAQIAFRQFSISEGIWGSPWVGLKHFFWFFNDPFFFRIVRNTLLLGFLEVLFSFPAPIILALLLNELRNKRFKRTVQSISYMPHFLSLVVIVGIFIDLTNLRDGKINQIIEFFGGQRIQFFADPAWFRPLYIITGIWQQIGWGSIIYLAAITGIDPQLYEAAIIDGANRRQQMWHITVASILPTITILFILQVGNIVTTNFQKILLMYNPGTYEVADTIGTYIFRRGILGGSLSYTTAVGLFRAVVAYLLLWSANRISKTVSEYYLW